MIDLLIYTKHGKFKLHSGMDSDVLYDIKSMLCDGWIGEIAHQIICGMNSNSEIETYVGIETVGAIISTYIAYINDTKLAIITKDNELVGRIQGRYCLVDDVVTTENTIRKSIELIGREPASICCVVDRREHSILKIKSMFKV